MCILLPNFIANEMNYGRDSTTPPSASGCRRVYGQALRARDKDKSQDIVSQDAEREAVRPMGDVVHDMTMTMTSLVWTYRGYDGSACCEPT